MVRGACSVFSQWFLASNGHTKRQTYLEALWAEHKAPWKVGRMYDLKGSRILVTGNTGFRVLAFVSSNFWS